MSSGASGGVRRPVYDVAFFAPYIGPLVAGTGATGGGETQVLLLARELAARGRAVAIVTFDGGTPLPASVDGVAVKGIPRPPRRGPLAGLAARLRLMVALHRALDAAVLVQRAAGTPTLLVAIVARLRRRRFVYASASDMDFDFHRMAPRPRAVALFHLGVRLAHAIVVQSEAQEALCRAAFARTATVVPSLAEPSSEPRESPDALLWIGRFAPYKRPLAMLDLAARLPNVRVRIVGGPSPLDPALAEEVERRAAEMDNVELLNARPRAELAALVRRAAAIVSTSEFEGMPNVFLEGWSQGVPALALAHDPGGRISREGLGWFAAGDERRFRQQAAVAWEHRHEQEELGRRCRAYVERCHSPSAVADRWEAVLFESAPGLAEPLGQAPAQCGG